MKPKRCKTCREAYTPRSPMQTACSPVCALTQAKAKRDTAEQKKAKEEKRRDREKKQSLKTRSDWIKETQIAFNRYCRLRDAGKPCICCGKPLEADAVGGGYDAGHYRSVGSSPQLRFHPDNCHGQRKVCNRYGAGRAVDYRLGLIARIGLARVEALEANQEPAKWTIEEL